MKGTFWIEKEKESKLPTKDRKYDGGRFRNERQAEKIGRTYDRTIIGYFASRITDRLVDI